MAVPTPPPSPPCSSWIEPESDGVEMDAAEMRLVLLEIIPACHQFHLLDENSYATVYRARHRTLNRLVAIKLVKCTTVDGIATNTYTSDYGGPPKDFSILQSIKHPHVLEILSIYRGGTCETTNIISEFIGERTVFDYVRGEYEKRHPFGPSCRLGVEEHVCRDIIYQLCQAMAYIHGLGIVHRNLKLDNILMTGDVMPFIKVAGFGLAARMPADGSKLKEISGSLDYMPPEMLSQSQPGYDCRADSWASGVMLMEMLLFETIYTTQRSYPEVEVPPIRWAELRAIGQFSTEGMELLEMLLCPDPMLRCTLADALRLKWLMYHRPMYPNIVYPEPKSNELS
ncbi:kinase-like domain-containing protein [Mycena haematopus]|nr:kinase-like domain-containing protein [Mycena haematopus]